MGANVTSFDDADLGAGTYVYRVIAQNAGGQSPPSQPSNAVTLTSGVTLTLGGATTLNEGSSLGLTITLGGTDSGSVDAITIDWGDGSAVQTLPPTATSASHTYADGSASRTVTATAKEGQTTRATASHAVTVNNLAPTLSISGPTTGEEDVEYTLTLSSSDPGDDTITHWTINWGDGTAPQQVSGDPSSATHTFENAGTFTISATATDEDGTHAAPMTVTVVVAPAPLAAPTGLDAAAVRYSEVNLTWNADAVEGETGFELQQSRDGTNFDPVAMIAPNAEGYAVTGLTNEKTYTFRLRAVRGSEVTDWIPTTVTTPAPPAGTVVGSVQTPGGSNAFASFGEFDPGCYRVAYVSGAVKLAPYLSWGASVEVKYNDGSLIGPVTYPHEDPGGVAEALEGRVSAQFHHEGGDISARFIDSWYSDNAGDLVWNLEQVACLPTVSIAASQPTASETGDDTERKGVFTVSRTGSTDAALTVQLHPAAGTALPGTDKDYPGLPSSVTIPAGESSVTIDVLPRNDGLGEPPETVVAYLMADEAYLLDAKEATVTINDGGPVDLDVDSDNDNGFAAPDRDDPEDQIEDKSDQPGKIIAVNDDDTDGDGIPDFADGYDWDGWNSEEPTAADDATAGEQFVPLVLSVPAGTPAGATITFDYDASDPIYDVTINADGAYALAEGGSLRLWTADGDAPRYGYDVTWGGNFLYSDTAYSLDDLGLTPGGSKTFYVEALRPSAKLADQQITVQLTSGGSRLSDAVRMTVGNVLHSLTVRSAGHVTRMATNKGKSQPSELYITANENGDAFVELSADFASAGAGSNVLWQIEGGNTSPNNPGNFSYAPVEVRLTPHASNQDRKFVVRAGVDVNGNGTLDHPDEVTHEVTVRVLHIGALDLWDEQAVLDVARAPDQTPVDHYVAETAEGDATVTMDVAALPSSFEAKANILWGVSGGATPSAGNFGAPFPAIKLVPSGGNRKFVVTAGFDDNGDQILQATEIERTINVFVVPRFEFSIQVSAFIAHEWVDDPRNPFMAKDIIYQGDDRTYSRTSESYRMRQRVTVLPYKIHDEDGVKAGTIENLGGVSTSFDKATSLDASGTRLLQAAKDDPILDDGVLKLDYGDVNTDDLHITVERLDKARVRVTFDAAAADALIASWAAVDIDLDLVITLDCSDPANPTYTMTGTHDRFPNFDVYINDQRIHGFDSGSNGIEGLLHQDVDASGNGDIDE